MTDSKGIVVSLIITWSISSPLENLVGLMRQTRNGNLTISIKDENKDEISEVIHHFDEMVSNIRKLVMKGHDSAQKVVNSAEIIEFCLETSFFKITP